jgi:hypothetical protein
MEKEVLLKLTKKALIAHIFSQEAGCSKLQSKYTKLNLKYRNLRKSLNANLLSRIIFAIKYKDEA